MWQWISSNGIGVSAFVTLIGYGIGAAKWAASMHTEVKMLREEMSFLREFRTQTGDDSEKQWMEINRHSHSISDHGERIVRIESKICFHEVELGRLEHKEHEGVHGG